VAAERDPILDGGAENDAPRRAMNGLLRRLTRRRAAPADEIPPGTEAASEPVDAPAAQTAHQPVPSPEEQERAEQAAAERRAREEERMRRARDMPAGLDSAELESPLEADVHRGRMRRRMRYLRAARELLLRDLGGFYYEVHRTAAGHQSSGHRTILETKAGRLSLIDGELRELESRLGEAPAAHVVVREPGIGGTCPECGELFGSEAHFCSNCGAPLSEYGTRRLGETVDATIAARDAPVAEGEPRAPAEPARGGRFGWPWKRAKAEPDPADAGTASEDTVAVRPSDDAGEPTSETTAMDAGGAAGTRDATGGRDTASGRDDASGRDNASGRDTASGAAPDGEPPTNKLSREEEADAYAERRS
jgi:hypothetical protein